MLFFKRPKRKYVIRLLLKSIWAGRKKEWVCAFDWGFKGHADSLKFEEFCSKEAFLVTFFNDSPLWYGEWNSHWLSLIYGASECSLWMDLYDISWVARLTSCLGGDPKCELVKHHPAPHSENAEFSLWNLQSISSIRGWTDSWFARDGFLLSLLQAINGGESNLKSFTYHSVL